jgi:hypothetical protein
MPLVSPDNFDIFCLPVDLQVMIVQPVVPQDQTLLPKTCDGQLCALQVVLIGQDDVSYVCDCAGVVCGAVDIVDWDQGCIGMLLSFAHSMSMKQPVALQSMRACVHHLTMVSVNSISTSTARDIGPGLAATMYLTGNRHSQAGRQLHRFEMGGWEGVCMTSVPLATHI